MNNFEVMKEWKELCNGICDYISTERCQKFGMQVGRITDTSMINGRRVMPMLLKDDDDYRKEFGNRIRSHIQFWLDDSITIRCKDPIFCRNTGHDSLELWNYMLLTDQETGKKYHGADRIIVTPWGGRLKDMIGTPFNVVEHVGQCVYVGEHHELPTASLDRVKCFLELQMDLIPIHEAHWKVYDSYKCRKAAIDAEYEKQVQELNDELRANAIKTINKQHILCERTLCCVDRQKILDGEKFQYKEL